MLSENIHPPVTEQPVGIKQRILNGMRRVGSIFYDEPIIKETPTTPRKETTYVLPAPRTVFPPGTEGMLLHRAIFPSANPFDEELNTILTNGGIRKVANMNPSHVNLLVDNLHVAQFDPSGEVLVCPPLANNPLSQKDGFRSITSSPVDHTSQ